MKTAFDFDGKLDIAWCPGCGNFGILAALKSALAELGISRERLVMVSGIGQAAKAPQYLNASFFNGLHGRSLPAATAIKASNPGLVVIAESGDGCTYGEGGNHIIHTIRRNPDITNIVHDNMVYGLTKGQASPTSRRGFRTPVQVGGVTSEPFNPVAVAVALNASFVARAFAGDPERTKDLIKLAISHKGYALVDVFQPCVAFNKVNTYPWFKEHTYHVDASYDPHDRLAAFQKACEDDPFPLGVLYLGDGKTVFEENLGAYRRNPAPLHERRTERPRLERLVDSFR